MRFALNRRSLFLGIVGLVLGASSGAAPAPVVLENRALRVELDPVAGRFQVKDKEAGYLWRGPDELAVALVELAVPHVAEPRQVDGNLADWTGPTAEFAIVPQATAGIDGPADLSGTAKVCWHETGLFVGVEVRDDILKPASADAAEWWHRDSVEFWVGRNQYAVRFGPWGANVWGRKGSADIETAVAMIPGGYVVELFIPQATLRQEWTDTGKGEVKRLRFALGINDCDDGEKRQGQLYYPAGWRHSTPETFALITLADDQGRAPVSAPDDLPAWRLADERPTKRKASFRAKTAGDGEPIDVTLTFELLGSTPELRVMLTAADPAAKVGRFAVLPPLMLDRAGGRILAARGCNGIGIPNDDLTWHGTSLATWAIDMPWIGLTDGKIGYLLLWELPDSCDNGAAVLERSRIDDQTLLAPGIYHYPIKGEFGASRIVRYSFVADGGHVAICKRFRDYIDQQGMLVTQQEKMRTVPDVALLAGAPDVWGLGSLAFCREAKAAGIDRMMINASPSPADAEAIKSLGYLISVYDNYEDIYEGRKGKYGDAVFPDDAPLMANGERKLGWAIHKYDPQTGKTLKDPTTGKPVVLEQAYKRCSARQVPVARRWTKEDQEQHPRNARFLDVTTATSLIECYDPNHGDTRTQDRLNKAALATCMVDEFGLVLGGEHGRWWGAQVYNYWEGMQSGGFYSWPAGYVGKDLPESRESIGDRYLQWGLGEANRYPLWELVYHDCVVSTWYWGDSTGHLHNVAPELGYKKDVFNMLYGTVPLYWTNRPFSYKWSDPELRERLLESYRTTCKLHEKTGFEELLNHEFVTADRAVQKSTFGGGTEVWVNFGEQPWTLVRGKQSYVLPQYGFYAKGPGIEQYRMLGPEGRTQTLVRTDDYLYSDASIPGLVELPTPGRVTLRLRAPDRIEVIPGLGLTKVGLGLAALFPKSAPDGWCRVAVDAKGEARSVASLTANAPGRITQLEVAAGESCQLVGPKSMKECVEVALDPDLALTPPAPRQGDRLEVTANLRNHGGKRARLTVNLYLAGNEKPVASTKVRIAPGATEKVRLQLATARIDGTVALRLEAIAPSGDELCTVNNAATATAFIAPNPTLWDSHLDLTVDLAGVARTNPVISLPFDLDAERAKLGVPGQGDPAAVRVVYMPAGGDDRVECPTQYIPGTDGAGELLWVIPGHFPPAAKLACRVYLDALANARHDPAIGTATWNESATAYRNACYSVSFRDGYIREVTTAFRNWAPVLGNLGVSSGDTGWTEEFGEVKSFDVVAQGSVVTRIRVQKNLRGGHFYDKLYSFYPDHFTVSTLSPERFGTLSRSYYLAECRFLDNQGNTAVIDGHGDDEGISGKNPSAQWYTTYADGWALSCVAVTPHLNVGYWDGSAMGGVSLSPGKDAPATVCYTLHDASVAGFAPDAAATAVYDAVHTPVKVTRE